MLSGAPRTGLTSSTSAASSGRSVEATLAVEQRPHTVMSSRPGSCWGVQCAEVKT